MTYWFNIIFTILFGEKVELTVDEILKPIMIFQTQLKIFQLIKRYFSQNKYEDLYKNLKDYKAKFNIDPSYELLKEIIPNIDLSKLDNNDIGFILFSFYDQFKLFESRNDYRGDFDDTI